MGANIRKPLALSFECGVMIAQVSQESKKVNARTQRMIERLRNHDLRALGRVASLVEDRAIEAEDLLAACKPYIGSALRIGITGPPGAGKSTLVDQMIRWMRERGQRVGVVAVDPSSPYTGGALLGDRIRMEETLDEGVYIRSMASRGALGGIARSVTDVCDVIETSRRDVILIETVGVGQDEVEVARIADVTVLVLVPGMGDGVQSLKAGVMEIADVFVVNKCDHAGGDQAAAEIFTMQQLTDRKGEWVPPVIQTVAMTGKGVEELMDAIARCAERRRLGGASVGGRKKIEELRLDHLGIAVKSLGEARRFYEMLGMTVDREETVEHEQVKVAMFPVGESRLKLLEAVTEDSVIGRFLAKRGEGLHHIALKVADVDAAFKRFTENGVRLVSDRVRVGAGGHRYFFVHPASAGGVLVEIVGAP